MRKLIALLLMALLLMGAALADYSPWTCPNCEQEGNTNNFCPYCGTARPEESAGSVISADPEEEIKENENLTQIPGETDWVSVNILRIDASAYIKGKKDEYLYAPWNATDEDSTSCWQFSTKKIKKNPPWLCMVVEGETVDGIWIRNGFQAKDKKGKDQYTQYSRLKDVTVVFVYTDENRENETLEFTLSDEMSDSWEKLDTGRHEDVDLVWFYVNSIYKGKSSNACLSEIMLVQNAPAETALPSWRQSD